jgi:putative transposase
VSVRREWIGRAPPPEASALAVSRQCALAGVARSWVYAPRADGTLDELDLALLRSSGAEYTKHPFYGTRRMVVYLKEQGYTVNVPSAWRAAHAGVGPGRHGAGSGPRPTAPRAQDLPVPAARRGSGASEPSLEHRHHLHPLRERVRLPGGRGGLVFPSGTVPYGSPTPWRRRSAWTAWRTRLSGPWAARGLDTDQGSQFTSDAFTGVLLDQGIAIAKAGRGRALDNIFVERLWRTVKYEDVYLKGYASLPEPREG